METKQIQLQIPDFLTIDQYAAMSSYTGTSAFGKLVHTVSALTNTPLSEVRQWDVDALTKIANLYAEISDHKQEFHSIIEWNGQLYGYAHIKQNTLGEYIDLENLCGNLEENMHKVAAIFYRPITKHRFDSIKFNVKQGMKMAKNDVENVFDWYEIEKYDSNIRKSREENFKKFPVHIFLGALSFFLSTASLYLNNTAYLEGKLTLKQKNKMEKDLLGNLLGSTGAGGGLFTTSLRPIFWQLTDQTA